jgi:hypothetical protein
MSAEHWRKKNYIVNLSPFHLDNKKSHMDDQATEPWRPWQGGGDKRSEL